MYKLLPNNNYYITTYFVFWLGVLKKIYKFFTESLIK